MNVSIMEYVRERKMIYATREILNGNKILDVAIEYGWESHSDLLKLSKVIMVFHLTLVCNEIRNNTFWRWRYEQL